MLTHEHNDNTISEKLQRRGTKLKRVKCDWLLTSTPSIQEIIAKSRPKYTPVNRRDLHLLKNHLFTIYDV